MPVDPAHEERIWVGLGHRAIIVIPKGADHEEEAWKLVKYLTTNDHALAKFSNGIPNVPSTRSFRRTSPPELIPDKLQYLEDLHQPQLGHDSDHADRPRSPLDRCRTSPRSEYAGYVDDVRAGLQEVDKTIDPKIKQKG